jgi:hypothetical protein
MAETSKAQDIAEYMAIFLPVFDRVMALFGSLFNHVNAPPEAHALLAEAKAAHAEAVNQVQALAPAAVADALGGPPKA